MNLPDEAWPLITLVFTTVAGGIGYWFRTGREKENEPMVQCEKRVTAAEKREEEAKAERKADRESFDKQLDAAIKGIDTLARTMNEQTGTIKSFSDGQREEMRRVHDGITTLAARINQGR